MATRMLSFQRQILLPFFLLLAVTTAGQHTVRFELKSFPPGNENDSLFLVGSFNGWNPGLPGYQFRRDSSGVLQLQLSDLPPGLHEFKITRGRWDKAECAGDGTAVLNRIFRLRRDTTLLITVGGWTDAFPQRPPVTTRSKNVFVADTAFFMPQLNRHRRIWVYLPEDYAISNKRYPVLYLQDGQNLFDALTASFGEWGVDEVFDALPSPQRCIVVGVDHGGTHRLTEYHPWDSRFGKGEGEAYTRFLAETLKPFIDRTYRTRPEKRATSIGGSSMGGLLAFYAALRFPDVYGGALVFSPSLWVAPQLRAMVATTPAHSFPALYLLAGELESDNMVLDVKELATDLERRGLAKKLRVRVVADGRHHESFWQRELPDAWRWLRRRQTR
ncbi:MAG TPA: alpha/beta hydrolase-fold protein [Lacibacter sp.]|nr:alpha/beta hydrolase-fold protein [Lacibacter sp.]HMO89532.1 alpha/beta hydrolase-fold protein [Lacibacter sp.]